MRKEKKTCPHCYAKRCRRENNKGVGLVELIIYIAIMGILISAITSFIVSNKKIGDRNEAINEVESQGNEVVEIISQTIRNSSSVTTFALGTTATQSEVVDNGVTIIFDLSGGKIRIKRGGAAVVNLNSDRVTISNLSFKNLGNATENSIQFQFDAVYANPGNKVELNYTKTFSNSASLR